MDDGLFRRVWRYAHSKISFLVSRARYRPDLEAWRSHDDDDNEKSSPPEDEAIDFRGVWAAEFYTPSFTEELLSNVSRLGWDSVEQSLFSTDMRTWIRNSRVTPAGSWHNLGPIGPPLAGYGLQRLPATLPDGFDHASGGLFALTPSITCIVIAFCSTEEGSKRLDEALRRKYQSYAEPLDRGYRIHRVENQKRRAVVDVRLELRASIAAWFRANLPGLFSSGSLGDSLPTCEFVSLRRAQPFAAHPSSGDVMPSFMQLLDMAHGFDAWQWKDHSDLRFCWPEDRNSKLRHHAAIATPEAAIGDEQLRSYGGARRSAYFQLIDDHMQPLICRWALLPLIAGLEYHLSIVRDSVSFGATKGGAVPLLDALTTRIHQSVDIAAVAGELGQLARRRWSFSHSLEEFNLVEPRRSSDPKLTLARALRLGVLARARALEQADRSFREIIVQYSAVLSSRENLRLQKKVGFLTWIIVALTIITAVLTALMAWDVIEKLTTNLLSPLSNS